MPPPDRFSSVTTPLIQKSYELFRHISPIVRKFSKPERYSLGERIENTVLDITAHTTQALNARQPLKEAHILKVVASTQTVQLLIRLAFDEKFFTEQNYFHLSNKALELHKMALGWLKSTRAP